jgi:hypothetical protein
MVIWLIFHSSEAYITGGGQLAIGGASSVHAMVSSKGSCTGYNGYIVHSST